MTEYFSLLLFLNIFNFCIMESCNMKEFYQKLCEIGCCKMCALRFLGETERRVFSDPLKTLFAKGLEEQTTNNVHKIQKNNTCIACLGMLEQSVIDNTVKKVSEEISKGDYDSDTFIIALTLPVSFQIRAHAMWLYLNDVYPQICQQIFKLGVVTVGVKDVWKWIVTPLIELCVSKRYDLNSDFVVTITFDYKDDNSEASLLTNMGYKPPGGRRPKNQKFDFYTRKGVDTFLNTVSTNLFIEHFGTPPKIPTEPVNCSSVSLQHNSLYFAGRYNKLSRHLPQTPWIIDGERRIEGSIQELISDPLIHLCQAETPKFAASGREDVDVRTLGSGRPFAIEFLNPHRTKFSFDEFRNMEVKINTVAHGQIAIRDLQVVDKDSLDKLKQGEEHKKKAYCAYCVVFGPLPDDLDKLSSLTPLVLSQKTPIRVLHRRPFAIRPRTIHTMKAVPHLNSTEPNGPSFFKLYVTTQAGTYIKEFVHGDFGRTTPNVGDLLGGVSIDILTLDVEDVSLDWPPPVNYNNVKSS